MKLETTILKNLVYSEEYTRKVLPFIQADYFSDNKEKIVFNLVSEFVKKYKTLPTHEALVIDLTDSKTLNDVEVKGALNLLEEINQNKKEIQ